jgi:hypothetical protein
MLRLILFLTVTFYTFTAFAIDDPIEDRLPPLAPIPKICVPFQGSDRDACFARIGLPRPGRVMCAKLTDQSMRERCYLHLISEGVDAKAVCPLVQSESAKSFCQAVISENPQMCPKDYSQLAACLSAVAMAKKDKRICKNIQGPQAETFAAECESTASVAAGDLNGCFVVPSISEHCFKEYFEHNRKATFQDCLRSKLPLSDRTGECVYYAGIEKLDGKACSHAGKRADRCFFELAPRLGDDALCSKIKDPVSRRDCETKLSYTKKCRSESNAAGARDDCFELSAIALGNSNYCQSISNKFKRDLCTVKVADDRSNPEACRTIKTPTHRNYCFAALSIKLQSADPCNSITTPAQQAFCYSMYVANTADFGVCEKISNKDYKNYCLAHGKREISACQSIKAPEMLLECTTNFAILNNELSVCNTLGAQDLQKKCVEEAKKFHFHITSL